MGNKITLKQHQRGFAAFFGVITLSLLMVTITVSSSRMASSELRQATAVDHSGRALKAAEAGLEEALMRIDADLNEGLPLVDVFPEGGTTTDGDMAILLEDDGSHPPTIQAQPDTGQLGGAMAWRNRVVRESSFDKIGLQVKDEIIEMDLSRLNELDENGEICGTPGNNRRCVGNAPIYPHVSGIEYCPTNIEPPTLPVRSPKYEWIITSYATNNPANIDINRYIIDAPYSLPTTRFSSALDAGDLCYRYTIPASERNNRRYIFRIKPLFETGNLGSDARLYSEYKVSYRTEILSSNPNLNSLVIADGSVLVDVTGESSDVRRRIIAKKQRNGRLLGVFDYLLYSGDPSKPLCKAGVLYEVDDENGFSYNLNNCDNSTSTPVEQPPVTQPSIVTGCTDRTASNWNAEAFVDDGSCVYLPPPANHTNPGQVSNPYIVPAGINSLTIEAWGAAGGNGCSRTGGRGGYIKSRISVQPGDRLYLFVGGKGDNTKGGYTKEEGWSRGGVNGGADGGEPGGWYNWELGRYHWAGGAAGGGASDVRLNGTGLGNRVLSAGGGGGAGICYAHGPGGIQWYGGNGGHGGYTQGNAGNNNSSGHGSAGTGGTHSGGGVAGGWDALNGGSLSGGRGAGHRQYFGYQGGGGGGGYFGGGGGYLNAGGGGGSSWTSGTVLGHETGNRSGNGRIRILAE